MSSACVSRRFLIVLLTGIPYCCVRHNAQWLLCCTRLCSQYSIRARNEKACVPLRNLIEERRASLERIEISTSPERSQACHGRPCLPQASRARYSEPDLANQNPVICTHLALRVRWRQQLVRTLEQDLPVQYQKPQDLSIFGDRIEFQDPVTTLRGKLPYRGMLCEF